MNRRYSAKRVLRVTVISSSMMLALFTPGGTLMQAAPVQRAPAHTLAALELAPAQRAFAVLPGHPRVWHRVKHRSNTPPRPVDAALVSRSYGATLGNATKQRRGPVLTDAQRSNIRSLSANASGSRGVEVYFDHEAGTPRLIRGRLGAASGAQALSAGDAPQQIARRFLRQNRALFKLDNPDREFSLAQERTDRLGKRHVRLTQTLAGIPMWGRELVVHLDRNNAVYLVNGHTAPTPKGVDTTPAITATQASQAATRHLRAARAPKSATELVFYTPEGGRPTLVYKVELRAGLDQSWKYFVDANNGAVLDRISNIHTAGSIVTASGTDLSGQDRSFTAWFENGNYYAIDPSTPKVDASYDPLAGPNPTGDTFIYNAKNGRDILDYNTSTSQAGGWDPAAVSAAANTRFVYDYYKTTFNRDSLDGKGRNLLAVIHYDVALANAFWNGESMVYGDGDNHYFGPLSKALDVAAHEMTHGVIESEARLIYRNQSGALNESFADVFAALVDSANWTLGETVTLAAPGFLRDMAHPSRGMDPQPEHMSQYRQMSSSVDNGGVHINSGIPNRAAYLTAEGLTDEGLGISIGRAKTAQIYYRALTTYLVSTSQFIDARHALIQSAKDLYGETSAEVAAVTAAWDAVGVKEGTVSVPTGGSSPSTTPVAGNDIMVYLYPIDYSYTRFDLWRQLIAKPFTVYDRASDVPLNNLHEAAQTRPAVYTTAAGTFIAYVGTDGNVYRLHPDGHEEAWLGLSNIGSLAVSADAHYLAYTTQDANDNAIHVINLVTAQIAHYPLRPPSYQQDGVTTNTIRYADALAFDYTGRKVLFDALNCMSIPGSTCSAGGGYEYWSIGVLDPRNGGQNYPLPNQNPAIDIGYPSFAYNNGSIIAVDVVDNTNLKTSGGSLSSTQMFDLQVKPPLIPRPVTDYGLTASPMWGASSFWGDDDYITVQYPKRFGGISVKRVPLNNQTWTADDTRSQELNDGAAVLPVMHRVGVRTLQVTLSADHDLLDFGQVAPGQTRDLTVVITNTGNQDIDITDVQLAGAAFSHNATNTRLTQGQSMTVRVSFAAGSQSGTEVGALTFATVDDPAALVVSLTGTVVVPPPQIVPIEALGSKGGGIGVVDGWSVVLLAVVAAAGWRRRKGRVIQG